MTTGDIPSAYDHFLERITFLEGLEGLGETNKKTLVQVRRQVEEVLQSDKRPELDSIMFECAEGTRRSLSDVVYSMEKESGVLPAIGTKLTVAPGTTIWVNDSDEGYYLDDNKSSHSTRSGVTRYAFNAVPIDLAKNITVNRIEDGQYILKVYINKPFSISGSEIYIRAGASADFIRSHFSWDGKKDMSAPVESE